MKINCANEFLLHSKKIIKTHLQSNLKLEGRLIEYRPIGGLDYHNSPLIGEIPAGDYQQLHRSIDQLRSLNERGILVPQISSNGTQITATTISASDLLNRQGDSIITHTTANELIQDFKTQYNGANFVVGLTNSLAAGVGNINGSTSVITSNGNVNNDRCEYLGTKLLHNSNVNGLLDQLNKAKENSLDKDEEKYIIPSNRSSPTVLTEGNRRPRKPKVRFCYHSL